MSADNLIGFRLSPQQKHLWLLQEDGYNAAYRVQCAILIEGDLDRDLLKAAIRSVVDRHEILRTIFHFLPGVSLPLQVVSESRDFEWSEHDLSGETTPRQADAIEKIFDEIASSPIHSERMPLLRTVLVTQSKCQRTLIISSPAVCMDAPGLINTVREIARSYGVCEPRTDEPLQYADLSKWQNELVEGAETAAGREFWDEREVRSAVAAGKLAWTNSFPQSCRFDPQRQRLEVSPETMLQVEESAALCGAAPAAFLLACWQVLLWRLSGLPQVVVGTAFAGRSYPELEAALGLFTRYLPLVQPLRGELRLGAVVQSAARQLSEAYEWQEYFSWEELGGAGAGGGTTAYSALAFGYEELPERFAAGELQFSVERLSSCVERYEVKLQCQRRGQQLELEWHYDGGRLSAREVERLAGQYATLVASACANLAAPIAALEVVSAAEREQLVVEWNRTAVVYPEAGACLHELFEAQVERSPAAIAVVYEGATLSYAELDQRANQVAHYLQGQGIGAESVVGMLLERSLELVVCLLGVLKAGAAYLPLDAGYPEARLSYMVADAGVQLLLTEEWLQERVGEPNCAVLV